MKNVLLILLGALIMFAVLKLIARQTEQGSQVWDKTKDVLKTSEFMNLVQTSEFKKLLLRNETKEMLKTLGKEQLKTFAKTLV